MNCTQKLEAVRKSTETWPLPRRQTVVVEYHDHTMVFEFEDGKQVRKHQGEPESDVIHSGRAPECGSLDWKWKLCQN